MGMRLRRKVVKMDSKCICDSPNNSLKNTHYTKRNISLVVTTKKDDEGIIIFEDNMAIACFDIKRCPICSRELSGNEAMSTKAITNKYSCFHCDGEGRIEIRSVEGNRTEGCGICRGTGVRMVTITLEEYESLKGTASTEG